MSVPAAGAPGLASFRIMLGGTEGAAYEAGARARSTTRRGTASRRVREARLSRNVTIRMGSEPGPCAPVRRRFAGNANLRIGVQLDVPASGQSGDWHSQAAFDVP